MGFSDLRIKPYYDSSEDDVLNDFYIPVLGESKEYWRLAGFFSSTALAVAAKGIGGLIDNDGKIRLIAGAILHKEDVDAIQRGLEKPSEVIQRLAIDDLNSIEDEFVKNHVSALGWLVAKDKLEIRIAIVKDKNGLPLDIVSALKCGIFHLKVGILIDAEGKMISFSGSINETAKAWSTNVEEFKVFRSWVDAEYNYFQRDYEKFNRYWNGESSRVEILEVPNAIKKRLIQFAPENIDGLNLSRKSKIKNRIQLRNYQILAIKKWVENEYKGFFEMATGTGKTFAAIGCLKEILKIKGRVAAVITCPYSHLVEQWLKDLKEFGLSGIKAYSAYSGWKNDVANAVLDYNNGYLDRIVILTTHDSFYSEKFINQIRRIKENLLLIADEVHGLGSPERRKGLLENYKFRLGLSATPNRWFDDEGTQILKKYFGEVVYEFPLDRAIKEGYLCPYEYHPHFVSLEEDELEEYRKETEKIAREYAKNKNKEERSKVFDMLCIARQKIVVNARQKFEVYEQILDNEKKLSFCLVYCSPEQIHRAQEILNQRGIINHRFTARETIDVRKNLLSTFSKGGYNVLVAMNCLDEGVNVPATRMAIIMASSGNPRQYIQRRGRILRKYPGKDSAVIHDFMVIPNITEETDPELFRLERKIMRRELKRYMEFANSAINKLDALNLLYPYMSKFEVYGPGGDASA